MISQRFLPVRYSSELSVSMVLAHTFTGMLVDSPCCVNMVFIHFSVRQIMATASRQIPANVDLMGCSERCSNKKSCKAFEFQPNGDGTYYCKVHTKTDQILGSSNLYFIRTFPVPTPDGKSIVYSYTEWFTRKKSM